MVRRSSQAPGRRLVASAPGRFRPGVREATGAPRLRLVPGGGRATPAEPTRPTTAIRDQADPRWVLAVRTAEQLEGTMLRPERRERLLRLGRMFGLSPFDCSLVIAIVQDQARRGHAPAYCPTAGEAQLRMIPLPRRATLLAHLRGRRRAWVAFLVISAMLLELTLLAWWF